MDKEAKLWDSAKVSPCSLRCFTHRPWMQTSAITKRIGRRLLRVSTNNPRELDQTIKLSQQQPAFPSHSHGELQPSTANSRHQTFNHRAAEAYLYEPRQASSSELSVVRDELSAGLLKATAQPRHASGQSQGRYDADASGSASRQSHTLGPPHDPSPPACRPYQEQRAQAQHGARNNSPWPFVEAQAPNWRQRGVQNTPNQSRANPRPSEPLRQSQKKPANQVLTRQDIGKAGGKQSEAKTAAHADQSASWQKKWLEDQTSRAASIHPGGTMHAVSVEAEGHALQAQSKSQQRSSNANGKSTSMLAQPRSLRRTTASVLQRPVLASSRATANPTAMGALASRPVLEESDTEADLRSDAESQSAAALLQEEDPEARAERGSESSDDAQEEEDPSAEEQQMIELKERLMASVMPDVHVVDTPEEAERIVQLLMHDYKDLTFACDTEVAFIDVKKQSPCGHGQVICFSIYGGDGTDFGLGSLEDRPRKTQLWVDTYHLQSSQESGEGGDQGEEHKPHLVELKQKAEAIFDAFKPFFEDASIDKVWHNYSFDRHVLANMNIHCKGFAGDTMHMARLLDSSRKGTKSYSLASLTGDQNIMTKFQGSENRGKISMKQLFGRRNITKDGKEGKLIKIPAMEELHSSEDTRSGWINYSAFDAKSTHQLYTCLSDQLLETPCSLDPAIGAALGAEVLNMRDFYNSYWKPFGELLTDMEKLGMLVNRDHLAAAEVRAGEDQEAASSSFKAWAQTMVPDAASMNVGSTAQIQQLFFAGLRNSKPNSPEELPAERAFQAPNVNNIILEGAKKPKKNIDITLWGLWGRGKDSRLTPDVYTPSGWPAVSTPILRSMAGKPGAAKKALQEMEGAPDQADSEPSLSAVAAFAEGDLDEGDDDEPLWAHDTNEIMAAKAERAKQANGRVPNGAPTVSQLEMQADKAGYGKLYAAFEGGIPGLQACAAVDSLCEVGAIGTLLSNFIEPLQQDDIATKNADGSLGRIHCSLNINTETGRLSARRPNLQNQPALEKDRYKVRKAFTADLSKGHHLVVADYGQLELRLLAHMTDCKSMLQAFKAGGDFHSRTALGMYDHIKEAIAKEQCLLEWDGPPGSKSPVPLLKDMFSSERRKAKILNFSIAYGKTAHGLSKDWKVDLTEAQSTVDRWYGDRPEVLEWQKMQKANAETLGYVTTMLGRRRYLPDASGSNSKAKGHALRAAINTPIQGSAADVATAAMISISRCPELEAMGWKLLLQVHDEVILEGPRETAAEAKALVVQHMEKPFNGTNPLLVDLNVDANTAASWYEAK